MWCLSTTLLFIPFVGHPPLWVAAPTAEKGGSKFHPRGLASGLLRKRKKRPGAYGLHLLTLVSAAMRASLAPVGLGVPGRRQPSW